jgi:hypothetical protein
MLNDNNIILIISNLSRYHLFPVQHEIRRRKRDYNNALSKIRSMVEPYISSDSNACDGINYWELADNFSWAADFDLSTYTRNFAARIIQRSFRYFKVGSICLKTNPTKKDNRAFKVCRRKKFLH